MSNPKKVAKLLAYNCVRNSPLEDLHAMDRISDAEMKLLMISITDRIYTALVDPDAILEPVPGYWEEPKHTSERRIEIALPTT